MKSLDELLKRIDHNNNKSNNVSIVNFQSFLSFYHIKEGLDKVPTYLIYYLYLKFLKKNSEILPLKPKQFFIILGSFVKRTRIGNQRYYLLDKNSLRLEENDLFESKIYVKRKKSTEKKV